MVGLGGGRVLKTIRVNGVVTEFPDHVTMIVDSYSTHSIC